MFFSSSSFFFFKQRVSFVCVENRTQRGAGHDSYECVCVSLSLSLLPHYCIRLKSARVYRNNTILCLHRKEDHKSWLFDTATREKDDSSVKLVVVVSKTRGGEKAPVKTKDVGERYLFFVGIFPKRRGGATNARCDGDKRRGETTAGIA